MAFFNLKLIMSCLLAGTVLIFIGALIFLKWPSKYSVYVAYYSLFFLLLGCGSKYSLYVEFTFYRGSKSDGIGTGGNAVQLNLSFITEG